MERRDGPTVPSPQGAYASQSVLAIAERSSTLEASGLAADEARRSFAMTDRFARAQIELVTKAAARPVPVAVLAIWSQFQSAAAAAASLPGSRRRIQFELRSSTAGVFGHVHLVGELSRIGSSGEAGHEFSFSGAEAVSAAEKV